MMVCCEGVKVPPLELTIEEVDVLAQTHSAELSLDLGGRKKIYRGGYEHWLGWVQNCKGRDMAMESGVGCKMW